MSEATDTTVVETGTDSTLSPVARVVVHRTDAALFAVHGTLVRASPGGLVLSLDNCVPNGKDVSLHITFRDSSDDDGEPAEDADGYVDGDIELDAKVAWSQPAGRGKWLIGCQCADDWPEEVFTMFAQQGHVERRREARRPTRLVATACWHRSLDQRLIDIIDTSAQGFAVRADKMGTAGERVVIRFNTVEGRPVTLAATLRWKVRTEAGYVGGCAFDDPSDHDQMAPFVVITPVVGSKTGSFEQPRQAAKPQTRPVSIAPAKPTRRRVGVALSVTLLVILIGSLLTVLWLLHGNRSDDSKPQSDQSTNDTSGEHNETADAVNASPPPGARRPAHAGEVVEGTQADAGASTVVESGPSGSVAGDGTAATESPVEVAEAAFVRGRDALAVGQIEAAKVAFEEAATAMPRTAIYQYHSALALHLDGDDEAAEARLRIAANAEREHGLANWGRIMSRVQGSARLWLERGRRQALAGE